ncbi:hypothetical protein BDV12DRAFT_181850 [Aspergillus spectabilis]
MNGTMLHVAIVGGGPSGLVLGLSLARYKVKSVILEKEGDITSDPRGVVLTGDALRSLWLLEIGKHISSIGQEYCTLLSSCEVVGREERPDSVVVQYIQGGQNQSIQAAWLIGADGKRGVVRKHFLEPSAGIRQEPGIFEYEGTWITANLKITLPTPKSHPGLPLWEAGYDSNSLYELFWPPNWHFCRPPGKPVACERFGPLADRLWHHEFAVPEWDDKMDADDLFWEHLTPVITWSIKPSQEGSAVEVTFPRDCIEVLRYRPFIFNHRVVNKWFAGRTILIGDAAHVFPPFAAVGLAWRLAILTRSDSLSSSPAIRNRLLQSWANERRNGELCTKEATFVGEFQLQCMKIGMMVAGALGYKFPPTQADAQGYRGCARGTFIASYGGGIRLGQIYVQTCLPDSPTLRVERSDGALQRVPTIFTLLVIQSEQCYETEHDLVSLLHELHRSGLHPSVLSDKSIVQFDLSAATELDPRPWPISRVCSQDLTVGIPMIRGYRPQQFMRRLPDSSRYLIVRPDNSLRREAEPDEAVSATGV